MHDYALLLSLRHECPEAHMVLLADNSVNDKQIMQSHEIGARGCLKYDTVQINLFTAIWPEGKHAQSSRS
jgi:hypothetical protein